MFDSSGKWLKQKVHVGRTQSGQRGFFTGHTLAFSLPDDQFLTHEELRRKAETLGFEYEEAA